MLSFSKRLTRPKTRRVSEIIINTIASDRVLYELYEVNYRFNPLSSHRFSRA